MCWEQQSRTTAAHTTYQACVCGGGGQCDQIHVRHGVSKGVCVRVRRVRRRQHVALRFSVGNAVDHGVDCVQRGVRVCGYSLEVEVEVLHAFQDAVLGERVVRAACTS